MDQRPSLRPAFGHFGYMEVSLVTQGRRSYSSLPELGHNAIEPMLRVLLQLAGSPLFAEEPSQLVYSIREVSSSRAGFPGNGVYRRGTDQSGRSRGGARIYAALALGCR